MQRVVQVLRGGHRVGGHLVRLVVVVVEGHDVDDVGRDHLLVGGGDQRDVRAAVGDLSAGVVSGVPAEGRNDVASGSADFRDVAAVDGRRDRGGRVAVPVDG